MGIIPAAAFDAAMTYAGDALLMPHPAALAAALAVLAVIGLHLLGTNSHATGARRAGAWPVPARAPVAALAVLPRLPQRVPQTRTPRPAPGPVVAACLLMRGPPDSLPRRLTSSLGILPR